MRKIKSVQFIKKRGEPEWAVIPYKDFLRFQELEAISRDIEAFKKALAKGKEELIPTKYAERLIAGENPIKVWREYRGMTQAKLAKLIDISIPYLSQIEHGERTPSTEVLKKLAHALKVALDDLVD